ncbi:ribonuclease HII [Fibrobacterales bacterium]|nr:ribonuclease HII [Fibrobacterales bacterium]
MNKNFYHLELLPQDLTLLQAQNILEKHFETALVGIDEAGRGPLAGPVVAAAVILKNGAKLPNLLNDSKKLTELQREKIFEDLPSCCEFYGIGEASAQEIDEIGILNADFLAMRRALQYVVAQKRSSESSSTPQILEKGELKILVDGNLYIREISEELQMPIIKGDGRVACIAAASIFAKVHRDRLMRKFAEQFPQYGFEKHKGYGTKLHESAICEFGLCPIHRRSFNTPHIKRVESRE